MENRDEELTLKTVDELVEQLLQTSTLHSSPRSPLDQTVHNLRDLFEEDRSLEQVWARLTSQSQFPGEGEKPPEEETRDGGNLMQTHHCSDDEVLAGSKDPLMTIPGKNGTIQKGKEQPMLKEPSPVPLDSGARRKAAPRQTRFPRAARFLQTATAILLVGALIAGFLLVFSMHSDALHRATQIGAQSSSPPGIYISRSDGVYRYNVQTRKVIWHTHVAGQSLIPGSPVLIGDTVYITISSLTGSLLVSALNAQTGALRWSRDFPHCVGSPFMDEGVLYYTDDFSGDILYAVQLPSEKLLWQRQLSTTALNIGAGGGTVVENGIVYIPVTPETTSQHGWIDAFDAHTGKQLWQSPAIMVADGGSTLTITNTMIYVASSMPVMGRRSGGCQPARRSCNGEG